MQLTYNDKQIELERDASALNVIFNKVSELIEQQETVFSHLVIDGVDVYEEHEAYIKEQISEIMNIEIITKSMKEMIWDTMVSVHEYLERAVPALKELVDKSYESFVGDTWTGINQLSEGMQWMLQFKAFTQAAPEQPTNWDEIERIFGVCEEAFAQLLEAVEAKDTVLISDILSYEVIPAYEDLTVNIAKSLQDKEFLKHVN